MYDGAEIMQWWLRRASRHKPKLNEDGSLVLFHGIPLLILSLCCLTSCIFLIYIWFNVPSSRTEKNAYVYFVILLICFLMGYAYSFLVWRYTKLNIRKDVITASAIWPGYPKTILWEDITEVSYNYLSESFVIVGKNKNKLQVSIYFYGIKTLTDNFELRLDPKIYQKVKGWIKLFHKINNE